MAIDGPAASNNGIQMNNAGILRWYTRNTTTQSYAITRYDDAGVYQDNPFVIDDLTGNIQMAHSLDISGYLDVLGHSAFGTSGSVSTSRIMHVAETFTQTSGAVEGGVFIVTANP